MVAVVFDLSIQRSEKGRMGGPRRDEIEVTVRAALSAKGDMEVEPGQNVRSWSFREWPCRAPVPLEYHADAKRDDQVHASFADHDGRIDLPVERSLL